MTSTETPRPARNGVDTPTLFATLDAVGAAPEKAHFQFRARSEWQRGTHSRTTFDDYYGVGEDRRHETTFVFDADHPATLVGSDQGPTPAEVVLHAIASCLTAGIANIAAARGVNLHSVTCSVVGDIDLNGSLGLDPAVRNGYTSVGLRFVVDADASNEVIEQIVRQSRARSVVFDIMTNGVPVAIDIESP